MIRKQKRKQRIFITEENVVYHVLYDTQDHFNGIAAWEYMHQYITLRAKAMQLQKKGLKVRIVLPDSPRRPMLVIGK